MKRGIEDQLPLRQKNNKICGHLPKINRTESNRLGEERAKKQQQQQQQKHVKLTQKFQ